MNKTPLDNYIDELGDDQISTGLPKHPIGRLGDSHFYYYDVLRGGMGEVYLCSFEADQPPKVALKSFRKEFFFMPECRNAFLKEVVIWSKLSGLPNIMPLFNIVNIDRRPFIMMPMIRKDNKTTLRDHLSAGRRYRPDEIYSILFQVLSGLVEGENVVSGLTHGDLKPENIIVSGDIMLTDFGLASTSELFKQYGGPTKISSTYNYRAPELWGEGNTTSVQSDVYSIGVIMYELLLGKLPLTASSDSEWRRLHQINQQLEELNIVARGFVKKLSKICRQCLSKAPEQRPQTFAGLRKLLIDASLQEDILNSLRTLMEWHDRSMFYVDLQKTLKPNIINGLLNLGENKIALEVFQGLEHSSFDKELWIKYGTTLSLNGDEHGAIEAYEHAMALDEGDIQFQHRVRSEYGLSIKRLGRYEEAIEIFRKLLHVVSRDEVPMVVINLASIYHAQRRYDQAIELLENSINDIHDYPIAFKSLGISYYFNQDGENGAKWLRVYLDKSIADADAQAYLGYCYFMSGRLGETEACLELALKQDYSTLDVFVYLLACTFLLDKKEDFNYLLYIVKRDGTKEDVDGALDQAQKLIDWYINTFSEKKRIPFPFNRGRVEELPVSKNAKEPSKEEKVSSGFSMPFINTRMYMDESMFSIDFYHPVNDPSYITYFIEAYNTITRDLQYQYGKQLMFRSTLLFYTVCPSCKQEILTNRDEGKELSCRKCDFRARTERMEENPYLKDLLVKINNMIDRTLVETSEEFIIFIIQSETTKEFAEIEQFCKIYGFIKLPDEQPLIHYFLKQAVETGSFSRQNPLMAFGKKCILQNFYKEITPPEVERMLRDIRPRFKGLRTLSSSIPMKEINGNSAFIQFLIGKHDELELQLEKQIKSNPYDFEALYMFITLNLVRKNTKRAQALSSSLIASATKKNNNREQIVATYELLGHVQKDLQHFREAIEFYEKSIKLDPTKKSVLIGLATCHQQLNEDDIAYEYYSKLKGIGA